jgi:hypothetical protein
MTRYRKKPVVVEAMGPLDDGNADRIASWCGGKVQREHSPRERDSVSTTLLIPTLEGPMTANPGDYVIRGVQGEFYPCKPNIFAETYEATDGSMLCDGEECTCRLTGDGEAQGWTVAVAEAERVLILCPNCTEFWRAEATDDTD